LTFEPEAFSYTVKMSKDFYLTYTGKTLIVKNLLISLCGYEIEMRGIPEKYVKEITTLVWGFSFAPYIKFLACIISHTQTEISNVLQKEINISNATPRQNPFNGG
jgi:hypothetical protein